MLALCRWIQLFSGSATVSATGVHVIEDIPTEVAIATSFGSRGED